MSLFYKVKWILGILMVGALIFATNQLDKENFSRIKNSVDTIFDDRLVAGDLLFKMTEIIHDNQLVLTANDADTQIDRASVFDENFESLLVQYSDTELTNEEERLYANLRDEINEAKASNAPEKDNAHMLVKLNSVKETLSDLFDIQLEEGRKEMSKSDAAIESVEFTTQMEYYILAVLALLIQILIMYSPKANKEVA